MISILPIAVWSYLVFYHAAHVRSRRGGGQGNVFSVGKAKARLFDKDNDQKVTSGTWPDWRRPRWR